MERKIVFKGVNNSIKERSKYIDTCQRHFGKNQILQIWSDNLIHVFENINEAIMFAIYRLKEIDFLEDISSCEIGNIGSNDIYASIHADPNNGTSCIMKKLDSFRYEYKPVDMTDNYFSDSCDNLILSPFHIDDSDTEYILDESKNKFLDLMNQKSILLEREAKSRVTLDINENTNTKISNMLDRYYGRGGWIRYWFSYKQLDRISVEVTLNVELSNNDKIINIPLSGVKSKKVLNYKKRHKGFRK